MTILRLIIPFTLTGEHRPRLNDQKQLCQISHKLVWQMDMGSSFYNITFQLQINQLNEFMVRLTSSKARMKRVHLRLPSIKLTKRFKLIPAPTTLHRQYKNTDMQIPRLLKVNGTSPTFIPKTTNQTYYWANNLYHNSRRPENSQISTSMIFHLVHVGYLNASAQ